MCMAFEVMGIKNHETKNIELQTRREQRETNFKVKVTQQEVLTNKDMLSVRCQKSLRNRKWNRSFLPCSPERRGPNIWNAVERSRIVMNAILCIWENYIMITINRFG